MGGIDGLFRGMRSAGTALAAERVRVDVVAENIANARVTQTPGGEAYRRKIVSFEPLLRETPQGTRAVGVRAVRIERDHSTPLEAHYEPGHPHADAEGIVRYPNVDLVREMADLITAMRAYESNLTVQESFVRMAERAIELARG